MSHTATVAFEAKDPGALAQACVDIGATIRVGGRQPLTMFDGKVFEGIVIDLPTWSQPIVITADNRLAYDNYNGAWGDIAVLEGLQNRYLRHVTVNDLEAEGIPYREYEENGEIVIEAED